MTSITRRMEILVERERPIVMEVVVKVRNEKVVSELASGSGTGVVVRCSP